MREHFLLDADFVFLNHGSFGACPAPVFRAYQRWQRELERWPDEFLGRRYPELLASARAELAAYVAAQPEDLVFVPNATTGVNVVARSLGLGAGDEVLGTDHEYGAVDLTWEAACERAAARYVRAPVGLPLVSHADIVEAIWQRVTERTRVLSLSHITSRTAVVLPVDELCRRAREAGILTVVDGAHAPGQLDLDLDALGADFYAGNCHKWLCAPKGSGFLHVRRERHAVTDPLVVSWGWNEATLAERHSWQGTRDPAAFLAVPAAIEFQREHDWPAVRRRCHALLRETRGRLVAWSGNPAPTPDSDEWFVQMATVELPACDTDEVQRRLRDDFGIEVPVKVWNGRPLLRISVQGYNTEEDLQKLEEALPRIVG